MDQKTSQIIISEHLWQMEYGVTSEEMKKYYCMAFKYAMDTKLQTLQYKILMNIYPCNLKLCHWRIKPSAGCDACSESDTIPHHFVRCKAMQPFWASLFKWWSNFCNKCNQNLERNIILGVVSKICHKPQLNFVILLAKWYVYRTKYLKQSCFFYEFQVELKSRLKIEEYIAKKNCKYIKKIEMWNDIYSSL